MQLCNHVISRGFDNKKKEKKMGCEYDEKEAIHT